MARTYITKTGDMLDMICYRAYERRQIGAVEQVIEANASLRLAQHMPVLPPGLVITLPDLADEQATNLTQKLWD